MYRLLVVSTGGGERLGREWRWMEFEERICPLAFQNTQKCHHDRWMRIIFDREIAQNLISLVKAVNKL
jgi:hypothetical protein